MRTRITCPECKLDKPLNDFRTLSYLDLVISGDGFKRVELYLCEDCARRIELFVHENIDSKLLTYNSIRKKYRIGDVVLHRLLDSGMIRYRRGLGAKRMFLYEPDVIQCVDNKSNKDIMNEGVKSHD